MWLWLEFSNYKRISISRKIETSKDKRRNKFWQIYKNIGNAEQILWWIWKPYQSKWIFGISNNEKVEKIMVMNKTFKMRKCKQLI